MTQLAAMTATAAAAVSPTTAPAVRFEGRVDLVRGGTLHLIGIGSNPATRPVWWSTDGSPIAAPKHSDASSESSDLNKAFADFAAAFDETIRPPEVTRQVAWRQDERPGENNSGVRVTIVRPFALVGTIDEVELSLRSDVGVKRYTRDMFQPYADQSTETFAAEGEQQDRRWQTFAIFTPGGPTQAGPITLVIGKDALGMATVKMDYTFDWPVRFVAIVKPGLRVEDAPSIGRRSCRVCRRSRTRCSRSCRRCGGSR